MTDIGVRQMSFQVTVILASLPIMYVVQLLPFLPQTPSGDLTDNSSWYATRYKDMKWPLLITFGFFLLVCILYCFISPEWSTVQYGEFSQQSQTSARGLILPA